MIRDEGLVENSRVVGAYLRSGLEALQARHPDVIAEVRGSGLYAGVEIAGGGAAGLVNAMRARRVLISATGRAGDTLKIRPPLVFSADDPDRFLEALDDALSGMGPGARGSAASGR